MEWVAIVVIAACFVTTVIKLALNVRARRRWGL